MSVYMIIDATVKDRIKYDQYLDQVRPMVESTADAAMCAAKTSGPWGPGVLNAIVIAFPSEDAIRRWLASPEYAAIASLREEGADTRAILVEGYPVQ